MWFEHFGPRNHLFAIAKHKYIFGIWICVHCSTYNFKFTNIFVQSYFIYKINIVLSLRYIQSSFVQWPYLFFKFIRSKSCCTTKVFSWRHTQFIWLCVQLGKQCHVYSFLAFNHLLENLFQFTSIYQPWKYFKNSLGKRVTEKALILIISRKLHFRSGIMINISFVPLLK